MRGDDQQQNHIFSYLSPEERVRKDHPLRSIRAMVDEVLTQLSRRFDGMYATVGRPSIAPEKLLAGGPHQREKHTARAFLERRRQTTGGCATSRAFREVAHGTVSSFGLRSHAAGGRIFIFRTSQALTLTAPGSPKK